MAEAFNDYFIRIGPRLATQHDEELSSNANPLLNENCHTFSPERFKLLQNSCP